MASSNSPLVARSGSSTPRSPDSPAKRPREADNAAAEADASAIATGNVADLRVEDLPSRRDNTVVDIVKRSVSFDFEDVWGDASLFHNIPEFTPKVGVRTVPSNAPITSFLERFDYIVAVSVNRDILRPRLLECAYYCREFSRGN